MLSYLLNCDIKDVCTDALGFSHYILNALLHPPEQCWGCFGSCAALIGGRSSGGAAGAVFSDTRHDVLSLLCNLPSLLQHIYYKTKIA